MNIIFFGSFLHYSTKVLESLVIHPDINVLGVVTTPPQPAGKDKTLNKTHVHQYAEAKHIPVFIPALLDTESLNKLIINLRLDTSSSLRSVDFFVVAGYGKLLSEPWLHHPHLGSLNLHFSLLPKFRGANPAEWAILLGETMSGVTLMEMSVGFDTGDIISQSSVPIKPSDNRESLYHKLYSRGAVVLPEMVTKYYHYLQKQDADCQTSLAPKPQPVRSPTPTAYQFKRDDGFIDWQIIKAAMTNLPLPTAQFTNHIKTAADYLMLKSAKRKLQLRFLSRATRALRGFPGVWTTVQTNKGQKRLKIHSLKINGNNIELQKVQLEGQDISLFNQIKNQVQ